MIKCPAPRRGHDTPKVIPTNNVMPVAARTVIVALFIAIFCSLFVIHYVVTGTSIFLPTSIGASPILFLKINYSHFRELDFTPSMWTTLYGAGGPTAVGMSSFNPILLLVCWIKPFANAIVAYEVVMRAFGVLGCYCLLRRNQITLAAAIAASGLFGFNVYSSSAGSDPQLGLSILLLPWGLIALQAIVERPGQIAALSLSASLALFYLVSTTQIFSFTILILFIPLAVTLWIFRAPPRTDRLSLAGRSLLPVTYIALAMIACLALTAFDLVEQFRNVLASLTSFVVPIVTRDYLVIAPLTTLIVVGLCAAACSRSVGWRLLASLVLLLGYGYGYHVIGLRFSSIISANFGWISIDDFIWDVQKPRFFMTALGTILLLCGLGSLVRYSNSRTGLLAIACTGAAYGLATLLVTPTDYYARFIFVPLLGYIALAALGVDLLLSRLHRSLLPSRQIAVTILLVVLVIAEAANMTLRQTIYTDALKYTSTSTPEMALLARLGPQARAIDTYENEHTTWLRAFPISRHALLRWMIPGYAGTQTFSRVGVSLISDDFKAFYDRALHNAYFGVRPGEWSPLLNVAAVTHLLSREAPDNGFTVELKGPDYVISRNPNAMPRVQLYHRVEVAPNGAGLDRLESSATPAATALAIVAPEYSALLEPLDPVASGDATITTYRAEQVNIGAKVSGRSLLILADTYHPGWRAWIDGEPAPILRANVAFRGLVLEPGEHKIEFRFAPSFRTPLLAIAVLALVWHLVMSLRAAARGWHCR